MAATRRIPLLLLLLTTFTNAVELTVSGDYLVGEAVTLNWVGESPFSLAILTATSAQDSFSLYRSFSPITVTNGVWNVDVAAGTLVEFEITDSTGDSASQFIQIDDGGAALSSSSVASQSSESVASTQSLSSVFSESSIASVSSLSVASTSSIAAASATSTSGTSTSKSHATPSPSQTLSQSPPATSSAASSTTGIVTPPNQLNTSSGPKPGAIAGGVIGAILGLLLLLVIGRICYRRRLRARDQSQDAKIYPFMVDEALTNTASSNHRRTLSRSKPDVVNWNPEEPHLTPAGPVPSGQEYFGNRNYRLSLSLGKFGELGETSNALGMELNPAPTPTPPQPVMTTVPNATMPSVMDLARGASKRASDMPLYKTTSIYNPTSLQQANFGRPSLDSQNGSGSKISPFADKFAVEGKYEPDLDDPAVMASVASAHVPRPPRPARPEGLELEEASKTDASASTSAPPQPPNHRNSVSNPGPVPTVGHTRKISGPIPIVMPKSPPVRNRQQRSVDLLPSWALVNNDGRYPAITVQTPTTATTVHSPTGSMAGVGAGRVASSQPGRQIYPAAALPPSRQPSLKGKRVSVAQSERGMSAAAIQAARAQSPPTVRSPPPTVRSPPPGAMQAQSPTAVATRAQSPPAIITRVQSTPVIAALMQSPPPSVSHKVSSSVDVPPRPPRAVGPRAKPVAPPIRTATPPTPIITRPLTPPRRILADPDVPTTPTTPALSTFPTPPRTMKNVTNGSSHSPSSLVGSMGHKFKGSGSSIASPISTISTVGPIPTTAATSAYPDIEFNGPTPVASPQVKGRALQPPPPISTGLNPVSSQYAVSSAPNGLSPITASPQSIHHPQVQHPQIPTPLASSSIGSPTTLAQFGQAMLPGGGGIMRDNSVKTTYTVSSEGAHSVLRRELMQGLPSAVGMAHNVGGPSSPTYFPEFVSNYHPPVPQLPLPVTSSSRVPRPAIESWGFASSIYDASSMNGVGKHVSIAPSYLSANSGRRLSESTSSGDAEWKELERQLAAGGSDVAHIMPKNNGTM